MREKVTPESLKANLKALKFKASRRPKNYKNVKMYFDINMSFLKVWLKTDSIADLAAFFT